MDIKYIIIGVVILVGALLVSIIVERLQNRANKEVTQNKEEQAGKKKHGEGMKPKKAF